MNEAESIVSSGSGGSKVLQASLIYQVLPAMVQNRIPTLPSLRRSVSGFHTRGLHMKNKSVTEMSLPETPPPGYTSRSGSGSTTPTSLFDISDDTSDVALRSGMSTPTPLVAAYETSTGVNWQHARHGMYQFWSRQFSVLVLTMLRCRNYGPNTSTIQHPFLRKR
jgi:hypothetical protein